MTNHILKVSILACLLNTTALADGGEGETEEEVPTVTSTSDPLITYGEWGEWTQDTTLTVTTQTQTTNSSSVELGIQTISRETTTTVTTPEERIRTSTTTVIDTYSDGSTVTRTTDTGTESETRNNAVSTVTDPGSFTGRMDQVTQMTDLNIHRNVGVKNGLTGGRTEHTMGNGYSGESDVISLGGHFVSDDSITFGAGLNYFDTNIIGTDSNSNMETIGLSLSASKHINGRGVTVKATANTASSDLTYSRTIGTFNVAGETTSRDSWGTLNIERSRGSIRPFAGVTVGETSTDGHSETGDSEAIIVSDDTAETYNYGILGINVETGLVDISVARNFDDAETMYVALGIERNITQQISFGLDAEHILSGDNESTYVSAGFKLNF